LNDSAPYGLDTVHLNKPAEEQFQCWEREKKTEFGYRERKNYRIFTTSKSCHKILEPGICSLSSVTPPYTRVILHLSYQLFLPYSLLSDKLEMKW